MKSPNVESVVETFSGDVIDAIPTKRNLNTLFAPLFENAAGKCPAGSE